MKVVQTATTAKNVAYNAAFNRSIRLSLRCRTEEVARPTVQLSTSSFSMKPTITTRSLQETALSMRTFRLRYYKTSQQRCTRQ
jgi:hypothetical protein